MTVSALVSLASISTIVYSSSPSLLLIAFFLLGMSASSQGIAFATIAEQFKKQFTAIGFGLNNAIITFVSGINAPCIGIMLDYIKKEASISLIEYQTIFITLIVISGIACITTLFFIKETFCKSAVDFFYVKWNHFDNHTS